MVWPYWGMFFCKDVQFKKCCMPVKTSCPPLGKIMKRWKIKITLIWNLWELLCNHKCWRNCETIPKKAVAYMYVTSSLWLWYNFQCLLVLLRSASLNLCSALTHTSVWITELQVLFDLYIFYFAHQPVMGCLKLHVKVTWTHSRWLTRENGWIIPHALSCASNILFFNIIMLYWFND